MAIAIPRSLVEFILLGPEDDRRQLQDSPILGDVWMEFAARPDEAVELLLTPFKDSTAGILAATLSDHDRSGSADIAYLQGIVAAKLTFEQVLNFVAPLTYWWNDDRNAKVILGWASVPDAIEGTIELVLKAVRDWFDKKAGVTMQDQEPAKRFMALAGLILWAQKRAAEPSLAGLSSEQQIRWILSQEIAVEAAAELRRVVDDPKASKENRLVWTISRNRRANPAIARSVPAVKGDATRNLFKVDCSSIVWAVIDSGIDASHRAFLASDGPDAGKTRVLRSFDFTTIRDLVSLDNLRSKQKRDACLDKLSQPKRKDALAREEAHQLLIRIAEGAKEGRSINWEIVERLIEIDPTDSASTPPSHHGTHVAGIIGANKSGMAPGEDSDDWADGMCPNIGLYDFRVLAPTLEATEFALIAALQFIRHINERHSFFTIHGANLSISIPHDVRNFACGRTPICNECERLVNSGVVVVAAAGNRGYQNFETKEGVYEGYAAFSVTDPGNADGVITVGATHRYWPHTYGVSFFSSRGPTGDGRLKPDLVAPGERIRGPLPGNSWGDLDGTSMAAPHVSGAAAMLMARYTEMIGQPRRIKQILCQSATDLGRERSFQGHGMLDVLRAFQSI